MSLLKKLSGRNGEDLSTEILAYFLSSEDRYIPFQKLFLNRILGVQPSSVHLYLETQTQATFEPGRPDLIIQTENAILILENKLGAYLSGDSQLVSYCEVFNETSAINKYFPLFDIEKPKKKVLIFLAPRKIIDLSISASDEACKKRQGQRFREFLSQRDITFVSLPWEEVLGYLDLNDSLQYELSLYVRDYINQELTREEKMILQNPLIPAAINKLFRFIDMLRNDVSTNKWNVGRMSQSYNYYGFYVEAETLKLFFGYFLPLWENFKTPIFIQVRESFIRDKNKDDIKKKLIENSFIHENEHEFIRPFKIDTIESWKDELFEILRPMIG